MNIGFTFFQDIDASVARTIWPVVPEEARSVLFSCHYDKSPLEFSLVTENNTYIFNKPNLDFLKCKIFYEDITLHHDIFLVKIAYEVNSFLNEQFKKLEQQRRGAALYFGIEDTLGKTYSELQEKTILQFDALFELKGIDRELVEHYFDSRVLH